MARAEQSRLQNEQKSEEHRQKTPERELEWIRMGTKGRQAKGKARVAKYYELLEKNTWPKP